MDTRDFCYWLRGFFELAGEGPLTAEQVKTISDHLKLVMQEEPKPDSWDEIIQPVMRTWTPYPSAHKHHPDGVYCYRAECNETQPVFTTVSC